MARDLDPRPTDIRKGKGSEPPRLGVPNNPRRGPAAVTARREVTYVSSRKRKKSSRDPKDTPQY